MPVTRRTLLASSATIFSLRGAAPAATTKDTVTLGFIGSGIRGKQLIEEFKAVPGARGVAVADLYDGCIERVKEQLEGPIQSSKDYRRLLDNKDIDAVVIATPDHWHERITLDALAAGKHVYVEKPMTWSIAEGPRIIAAAKASGKVLQVGSQAKTSALTAKAKELVASGALHHRFENRQLHREHHHLVDIGGILFAQILEIFIEAFPDHVLNTVFAHAMR